LFEGEMGGRGAGEEATCAGGLAATGSWLEGEVAETEAGSLIADKAMKEE